ncbi:zinc finger Ran-binding domain-containing protein 2-like isoform X1 [Senna tora]|uniref:Zinc finger Ran-binding domain-containing protein 2-like isoform X1 n=1 Tax=Senna tora TaxID=362788 RepID=A0A834SLU5_9FABA|nr:zinc finger Ran-binding domain-containing protein 2-like isoform X1 [Senna tora]
MNLTISVVEYILISEGREDKLVLEMAKHRNTITGKEIARLLVHDQLSPTLTLSHRWGFGDIGFHRSLPPRLFPWICSSPIMHRNQEKKGLFYWVELERKFGKMSYPGGDWMCGACQHVNFKRRDTCQRCGYPKFGGHDPSSYGSINRNTDALAGDWFCTVMNCGAHNYASRSSCFKCGTLKDDYAGSGGYGSGCSFPPGWKPGDWICSSFLSRISSIIATWNANKEPVNSVIT